MRKIGLFILILGCCCFLSFAYAENIVLKSGKAVKGKIIERAEDHIKVDFYGTPFTYYFDEIESIDGVPVETQLRQKSPAVQKKEEPAKQSGVPFIYQSRVKEYTMGVPKGVIAVFASMVSALAIIELLVAILIVVSWWVVFVKAGYPGWASIIPFYNIYVMLKVAGRPGTWFPLLLLPLANIVITAKISIDIAKKFGKDIGFGMGLFFLPFIFFPILAFGSAQYRQSNTKESTASGEKQE